MSESAVESWQDRAAALQAHGIPERRAQVVALIEAGYTHTETAEALEMNNRSTVSVHVREYRDQFDDIEWLAEHAPDI